ncbi:MAG: hypothetical protein ACM3X9_05415 [Bacillota bacterium]
MSYYKGWEQKLSPLLRESACRNSAACGRVIIEFSGRENRNIKAIIERGNGRIMREIALISSIIAEVPLCVLPELAKSNQVKKIWTDSEVRIL